MEKSVPNDLILEILRPLPVKSLRRFESVSKSWYSLIHNPLFITHQLNHAAETESYSALIRQHKDSTICLSRMHTPGHWLVKLNLNSFKIIGSSNGLICFVISDHHVIISNMFSKPEDYVIATFPSATFTVAYGFGYDSVNNNYKVLRFALRRGEHNSFYEILIYSMKSNRLRCDIRLYRYTICPSPNGIVASGALHWLAKFYSGANRFLILAFDLATEKFYDVLLPEEFIEEVESKLDEVKSVIYNCSRLGEIRGCICFSNGSYVTGKKYHEIWVMEEYGIQSSWTKLFRVESRSSPSYLSPLMYSRRKDKVLFSREKDEYLYWYDLRCGFEMGCTNNPSPMEYSELVTSAICLETLVSVSDFRACSNSRGRKEMREEEQKALRLFLKFREKFYLFLSKK